MELLLIGIYVLTVGVSYLIIRAGLKSSYIFNREEPGIWVLYMFMPVMNVGLPLMVLLTEFISDYSVGITKENIDKFARRLYGLEPDEREVE